MDFLKFLGNKSFIAAIVTVVVTLMLAFNFSAGVRFVCGVSDSFGVEVEVCANIDE